MMARPPHVPARSSPGRIPGLACGCALLGIGLLAPLPAAAQADPPRASWEFGGGGSIPVGRFADTTGAGFTIALGPEFERSRQLAVGGEVAFSRYGTPSRGGEFTNLAGSLYGTWRFRPEADVGPYLRAGVAIHLLLVDFAAAALLQAFGFTTGDWGTRFGEFVGGGLAIRGSPSVGWRVDASYHHISNADAPIDYVDVTVRIVFIRGPAP